MKLWSHNSTYHNKFMILTTLCRHCDTCDLRYNLATIFIENILNCLISCLASSSLFSNRWWSIVPFYSTWQSKWSRQVFRHLNVYISIVNVDIKIGQLFDDGNNLQLHHVCNTNLIAAMKVEYSLILCSDIQNFILFLSSMQSFICSIYKLKSSSSAQPSWHKTKLIICGFW